MKRFFLSLFTFHLSLFCFAQNDCSSERYRDTIFHNVTVTTNVYFGTALPFGALAQPQDLYMDIYEPANDTLQKRPLIIFQFGGGFTIGWRTEPVIPEFCTYFAKCGYAVATIDYRIGLNPADTQSTTRAFYRGVQDERAAIRFLAKNAELYKIDTSFIFLTGTSAGCFCGLANAFMTDADRPAATFGTNNEPDDLGCMDCSGNTDFGLRIPKIKAVVNQWGAMLDTSYIKASENTPVISFHGDQDLLVPYEYGYPFQLPVFPRVYGSKPIHERLNSVGIHNELRTLVGYGHEPELLAPHLNDTIYNYTRKFLFPLLKPALPVISGPTAICKNDVAVYTVQGNSKYCWQINGNGTVLADAGNSIAVQWNDTGSVSVSVKELNYMLVESDTAYLATQIVARPESNFGYVKDELSVTLSNWSMNADSFYWNFGDGNFSSEYNPLKEYNSGGTYNITLIADNSFCTDTFSTSLTVDSCPVANFTYQLTNFNGFFYADTTNTILYYWNFGDGDSFGVVNHNVFHQYQQPGTYCVTLKVQNQLGCTSVDSAVFTIAVSSVEDVEDESLIVRSDGMNTLLVEGAKGLIQIRDVQGRLMAETELTDRTVLDISHYPPAVYYLAASIGDKVFTRKFIKKTN